MFITVVSDTIISFIVVVGLLISNISSASGENLQPLKYALSNLINSIKEDV